MTRRDDKREGDFQFVNTRTDHRRRDRRDRLVVLFILAAWVISALAVLGRILWRMFQ